MYVVDLNGEESKWTPKCRKSAQSSYHKKALKLLAELYPTAVILNEVELRVRRGQKKQYLDIFLPLYNIAIEIHGEQHYKYNTHFHGTILDFIHGLKLDREKVEWCELNSITLIELPYNKQDEWYDRMQI
jgi:hypothetical protein